MNIPHLLTKVVIITIVLFINKITLKAQFSSNEYAEASQFFESAKDPDHDLTNGRLLMPNRIKTYGHPFLGIDEFLTGEIIINNRHFEDVELKYDILDQHVITEFSFDGMAKRPIILNNEFIDCFIINNKHFIQMEFPELGKRYFQEISGNSINCYYYFFKRVEEKSEGRYLVRQIHPMKVLRFLKIEDEFLPYKSNRSFMKKFDEKFKSEIKKYLKSNKLNVKTISDSGMESLLLYCENLITNE